MILPKDKFILLSFLNTKLRDEFSSLDLFCQANNLDKQNIINDLASINYFYIPEENQFK